MYTPLVLMMWRIGLEPVTFWLTVRRSANWAMVDKCVVADVPTTGHAIDLIPTLINQLMFKIEENLWVDVLLIQNRLTVPIF